MEDEFEMPVLPRCEDCRFAIGDFTYVDEETDEEEWMVHGCKANVSNWPDMLEDASDCSKFMGI